MPKNPLKEGAFGRYIVEYFKNNENEGEPIEANCLSLDLVEGSVSYRITFQDGRVSDWKLMVEGENDIVSAEKFNEVS